MSLHRVDSAPIDALVDRPSGRRGRSCNLEVNLSFLLSSEATVLLESRLEERSLVSVCYGFIPDWALQAAGREVPTPPVCLTVPSRAPPNS